MGSYTEKLKLFKYDPSTDGNVPFSIQQALNDNWDKIDAAGGGSGSGLEIGDIGIALYVDETKGLRRRLNGSILSINTNTQGFVTFLKGLQATSPSLFVTETNWQAEVNLSKFGQCGKFVLNETAGTIRLPKVVNINGLQDLNQAGVRLDEKLPNITATVAHEGDRLYGASGAITLSGTAMANGTGTRSYNTVNFDASLSSPTYQNGAPVQQEAVQYPYFIQIATGETTEVDIINEIELNNPYSLFDCKYTDHKLNNLSWLLSQGQWNSGSVYVDAFQLLLRIFNGTETIEGISVKDTNGSYTDYDFVIDTVSGTFRLPLKSKIASGKAVVGNGMSLGLTNGRDYMGLYSASGYTATQQASNYYGRPIDTYNGAGVNATVTAAMGLTTDSSKSGIELSDDGVYLYYYVGETVQNANLVDIGRIAETIAAIAADIRIIKTYVNGTSGYRVWSDGYCEQWGMIPSGSDADYTITLLKEYKDLNYQVGFNIVGDNTSTATTQWQYIKISPLTTTTVKTKRINFPRGWRAWGYLAEGQN